MDHAFPEIQRRSDAETSDPVYNPICFAVRNQLCRMHSSNESTNSRALTYVAKKHRISRASVCRLMKQAGCEQEGNVISSQPDHRPGEQLTVLERAA